jgi:hypothetical protein
MHFLRNKPTVARHWLIATGLLALMAICAGGAIAANAGSNSTPPEAGAATAIAPDQADANALGILRRSVTAVDQIPPQDSIEFSGASGANVTLARRAQGISGAEGWVVPGKGSLCVIAEWPASHAGGAACMSDADAVAGNLAVEAGSTKAVGMDFVAGVVPDGISEVTVHLASGTIEAVAVHENMYATGVHGSITGVTASGPAGHVNVEGIGPPATRITN